MRKVVRPGDPRREERILFGVGLAVLAAVLVAGLIWPVISQERNRRVPRCKNHLKQLGLALHNYHDTYGCLPPAVTYGPDGRPWHSWRVLLLPFLDRADLARAYRFDQPWDGPENRRLLDSAGTPKEFRCPQDEDSEPGTTSYLAVVGEGTLWPTHGTVNFEQVADGTGRTVVVVEVSDSGVPWTRPLDLRLDAMSFAVDAERGVGIRSRHENGANVLMADGSGRYLGADTPLETVRSLLLRDDGGPGEVP